jgi:DNA processing protein
MDDLPNRLALHRKNLASRILTTLLDHYGSADAVLSAPATELAQFDLSNHVIGRIKSPDQAGVERDLSWQKKENHHIVGLDDPGYPSQLRNIPDPPYLLYIIGDTDYLSQPQLAMVGSRTPTAAGKRNAKDFARHLSDAGLTITSGLARGLDSACHAGALLGIAGTVAVVANGLNKIYPAGNTQLAQQISEQGCIVSEAPIGTEPHKGLFPKRNRIISGLAVGTLVVEAAKSSGSLITARHAMEQGREVFAIPGSIHNPLARGCHSLIRQGAKLVETAEDVLEELLPLAKLPSSSHTSAQNSETEAQNSLDPAYETLLECMEYEPASIDELVNRSSFNAAEIASMLLILELQGQVVSESGRYCRVKSQA